MWRIGEIQGCARQAWEWYKKTPDWLRQSPFFDDCDFELFAKDMSEGWMFGGWDGRLSVIVQAVPVGHQMVEGHIFTKHGCSSDLAVAVVGYAKGKLRTKQDIATFISMIHHRNRPLKKIIERAGFRTMGLTMIKGQDLKGNLYKTEMYVSDK